MYFFIIQLYGQPSFQNDIYLAPFTHVIIYMYYIVHIVHRNSHSVCVSYLSLHPIFCDVGAVFSVDCGESLMLSNLLVISSKIYISHGE